MDACEDGRKICYYVDGDLKKDVPIFAFHGGCESKWKFAQKEPIPGIAIIAVDRPHYGGSSGVPGGNAGIGKYTFSNIASDIAELADHLGLQEFLVTGHSIGTSWCQQLAVALPERVKGVILWSTMIDSQHPRTVGEFRAGQQFMPVCCGSHCCATKCMDPVGGCCGCCLRGAFSASASVLKSHERFSASVFPEATFRVDRTKMHTGGKEIGFCPA